MSSLSLQVFTHEGTEDKDPEPFAVLLLPLTILAYEREEVELGLMGQWLRGGQVVVDGEEGFGISKPLVILEEEEGMDKGLGLEEKGEGEEGVEGVGGFEMESPKWDLALRIKEWM